MAKASGIHLLNRDAEVVLGMVARGDREHDIAAWFGVNQGRVAEVKKGSHGPLTAASADRLPPKGPPGIKGRRLRAAVAKSVEALDTNSVDSAEALEILRRAIQQYDANEL